MQPLEQLAQGLRLLPSPTRTCLSSIAGRAQRTSPAIHLVEREKSAGSTLHLHTARFLGKNQLKAILREPLPYDAVLHAQTEKDKHCRSLLRETTLTTTT